MTEKHASPETKSNGDKTMIAAVVVSLLAIGIFSALDFHNVETTRLTHLGERATLLLTEIENPNIANVSHYSPSNCGNKRSPNCHLAYTWRGPEWVSFDTAGYRVINAGYISRICPSIKIEVPYSEPAKLSAAELTALQKKVQQSPARLTVMKLTAQQLLSPNACPELSPTQDGKILMNGKVLAAFISVQSGTP